MTLNPPATGRCCFPTLRNTFNSTLWRHTNPEHNGTERGSFEDALVLFDFKTGGVWLAFDAHEGCSGHNEPNAKKSLVTVLVIRLLELLADHYEE